MDYNISSIISGRRKKAGNSRKHGRDKKKCSRYEALGKRIINKINRLERHLKKHSLDSTAVKALERCLV